MIQKQKEIKDDKIVDTELILFHLEFAPPIQFSGRKYFNNISSESTVLFVRKFSIVPSA